jgi:hypothetical protein
MNDHAVFRRFAAIEHSRRSLENLKRLKNEARFNPPRPAQGRFPYFTKGSAHA